MSGKYVGLAFFAFVILHLSFSPIFAQTTPTPIPEQLTLTINEQELFNALRNILTDAPDAWGIDLLLPDFQSEGIVITARVSGGMVGLVELSVSQADGYIVMRVTRMTVDGKPAHDTYQDTLNAALMPLMVESLDALIAQQAGANYILETLTLTENALILVVQSATQPIVPTLTPTPVPTDTPTEIPAIWAGNDCGESTCNGYVTGSAPLSITLFTGTFASLGDLFHSSGDIMVDGTVIEPTLLYGNVTAGCEVGFNGATLVEGDLLEGVTPRQTTPPLPIAIDDFSPGGYFANLAENAPEYGLYYAITLATIDLTYWQSQGYYEVPAPYRWVSNGTWTPDGAVEGLYYVEFPVVVGSKASFIDTGGSGTWDGITIASTQEISFNTATESHYYLGGIALFSDYHPEPLTCNTASVGISAGSYAPTFAGVLYAPWSGVTFDANIIAFTGAILGQFVRVSVNTLSFDYTSEMIALPD